MTYQLHIVFKMDSCFLNLTSFNIPSQYDVTLLLVHNTHLSIDFKTGVLLLLLARRL